MLEKLAKDELIEERDLSELQNWKLTVESPSIPPSPAASLANSPPQVIKAITNTNSSTPDVTITLTSLEAKITTLINNQENILSELAQIKSFLTTHNPSLTQTSNHGMDPNASTTPSLSFPSFSEMINTATQSPTQLQEQSSLFSVFPPLSFPFSSFPQPDTNISLINQAAKNSSSNAGNIQAILSTPTPTPRNSTPRLTPIPNSQQPKPLKFPDEEVVSSLYKTRSKYNFCVGLLNNIYPNKEDLENCNVNGTGKKRSINTCVVGYLKDTFFQYYNCPESTKDQEWKRCTKSINSHLSKYVNKK